MKTLYIDCGMGAAGDMLTAALLELVPDRDSFLARLNGLGLPGVVYEAGSAVKCGIRGTHVSVLIHGAEEADHPHHEHHDHPHTGLDDVSHVLSRLDLPETVRNDAMAVYESIAEAESHVHGVSVKEIHFHEVGSLDAIADVVAVCLLMDAIAPEQVVASPVHVGSGQVRCAHGVLPVPAPATAYLLRGVPICGGEIRGELCTPTGAALLRHFVHRFGPLPTMRTSAIGYGMGKKDFPAANCVRVLLGETENDTGDVVAELSCNVDDMTAEEIGFAMERLLEAGALDVFTVPVGMKKNRPGTLIRVLCAPADKEKLIDALFRHTTTLGLRENLTTRHVQRRRIETLDTPLGPVRVKKSAGHGVSFSKFEYEDLARIARERGISLAEARRLAEEALL